MVIPRDHYHNRHTALQALPFSGQIHNTVQSLHRPFSQHTLLYNTYIPLHSLQYTQINVTTHIALQYLHTITLLTLQYTQINITTHIALQYLHTITLLTLQYTLINITTHIALQYLHTITLLTLQCTDRPRDQSHSTYYFIFPTDLDHNAHVYCFRSHIDHYHNAKTA